VTHFCVKASPDARLLLIPSLSGYLCEEPARHLWTRPVLMVAHITLTDLACGAAGFFDTLLPCHDDSSAVCPSRAFVTVYSSWWIET